MRIGGKEGIAFWGDGNAGLTDTPNMVLTKEGLFQVRNDMGFLAGNVLVKYGRNNNPTSISKSNTIFRVSGQNGVAILGNNNSEIDDFPKLRIENNVGIDFPLSTSLPYKFNVAGSIYTESQGIKSLYGITTGNTNAFIGTTSNHGLYLGTNGIGKLYLSTAGSTWIGVSEPQRLAVRQELLNKYMLFVGKGVLSEDFAIAPVASWAEFVFNSDYRLKPLHQVENFIKENKHLPDVPSAKDVAEYGYSQHEMNKALLQKIEELTLYVIQQQKEIEILKSQNE